MTRQHTVNQHNIIPPAAAQAYRRFDELSAKHIEAGRVLTALWACKV